MTTDYHVAFPVGTAANAAEVESRFASLDAGIGVAWTRGDDALSIAVPNNAELVAARGPYPSVAARFEALVLSGGNVATKANGASVAGQKVLTVDDPTGFIVGAYVTYLLNNTTLEGNLIASIQPGVSLTLTTNIGTGGVLDDTPISMISISEYLAAQAIPHAGTLMLPQTMEYSNRQTYYPEAYGAGGADDTVAFENMFAAIRARSAGRTKNALIELEPGANYTISGSLNLTDMEAVEIDGKSFLTTITYADADATATNRVLFDCIGSARLTFKNFTVTGDSTNVPAVAFSLGRSTTAVTGTDSGQITFERIAIKGFWSKAGIYNTGAELVKLSQVWITVSGPDTAGTKFGVLISDANDLSIGSEYATHSIYYSPTCPWIENCSVGGGGGWSTGTFIPFSLRHANSGAMRDSYAYTYASMPCVRFHGTTTGFVIDNLLCEGSPDKSIWFAEYSGAESIIDVSLRNVQFGGYANHGIYSDAAISLYFLTVENCTGFKTATSTSKIKFLGTVQSSNIDKWWTFVNGTMEFADLYYSRLRTKLQTLTITAGSGNEIFSDQSGNDTYRHLTSNLRVGAIGTTGLAQLSSILVASSASPWAPGTLADGAAASTSIGLNDCDDNGQWFCQAAYPALGQVAANVLLSAWPGNGVVVVSLLNKTGGNITPSGTLYVTAMKITAA
jgi:hypothetical protein